MIRRNPTPAPSSRPAFSVQAWLDSLVGEAAPTPKATGSPAARLTYGPIGDLRAWRRQWEQMLDGRPVVLSLSGGKDSTACGLLLQAAGIPFTPVHMDTGWEHEDTEHHLRTHLTKLFGSIVILKSKKYPGGFRDLVQQKGMFPNRLARFCTQELKVKPFLAYLAALEDEPVNVIGIRAEESRSRAKMPEWSEHDKGFDCPVWRPIIAWTYEDVIRAHQDSGVKPNSLYLKRGVSRVGCWPCIFADKIEMRAVAMHSPERIDEIEALEARLNSAAAARMGVDEVPIKQRRSMFHRRSNMVNRGESKAWPIREAIEWSKTKRGGKVEDERTAEDFAREGCMRWGMCEK